MSRSPRPPAAGKTPTPPAAYFVIEVRITDPEGIKPYQARVEETYKAFGGERLVAGASPEVIEGEASQGRIVILRFPSLQHAQDWHESPAYRAILGDRLSAAESRAYFVEGVSIDGPHGLEAPCARPVSRSKRSSA